MVKHDREQKQSGIALILLISFVLGSLLSFVHGDVLNGFLLSKAISHRAVLTQCFALTCVVAPSVNAWLFIPLLSALCGTAIAAELDSIYTMLSFPTAKILISVLMLLIIMPAYFFVSGWGMSRSIELEKIIRRTEPGYTKENLFSLTIMLIGLGLLLFGQNIMPI